jgi:UDP-glucose 4-epimerase
LDVEKPNYVVHLAALPLAGLAIDAPEEAFRSLLQGTANVLDAVRSDSTIEKLVIVSSSMVYGDFGSAPQAEGAAKSPKDLYGSLKLMGEILTGAYGGLYDIPFAIVRPSAVYGPADNNQRVVQTLLERAMQELPIYLEEPEATFLDFTSVEDLARGIAELTLSDAAMGEAFNLTYGKARSLAELVEIIRFHFPDLEVNVGARSEHFRPRRGTLDTSKAATSFGYCPSICLEDGVAAYLKYMTLHNPSLTKAPVADASPAQKPRSS